MITRDWVDQHMNCEDIAFNLMAANATGLRSRFIKGFLEQDTWSVTRSDQGRSSNAQLQAVKMWACSPVLQVSSFGKILWTSKIWNEQRLRTLSSPGHLQERSRCLDLFMKLYGDPCPLRQVRVNFCVLVLVAFILLNACACAFGIFSGFHPFIL